MGQLSTYQTQVTRLLHDEGYQLYSQSELTDYINVARNRVAQDSKCLRQLVAGVPLVIGQDFYVPQTFLPTQGLNLVDVMGITLYWGTMRIKLQYFSYTELDALYRRYSTYTSRPSAYARMGATNVVIAPAPDQAYITDWDIAVVPAPLVSDATAEQLPIPFLEPVPYYAAYQAKWKEQAMGEAGIFKQQYIQTLGWCARSFQTRAIRNPYRIGA